MSAWRTGWWPACAKSDGEKWTAHISNKQLKCFEIAVNGSSIHVMVGGLHWCDQSLERLNFKFRAKNLDLFAFFWSRLALQPENRCKTSNRLARERTRCIQNINS